MALTSRKVFPLISSVSAEPHAIAGTHPLARKVTSMMRSASSLAISLSTSPQAGFSTCADRSGETKVPAFRGCSKWSSTCGEYMQLF